VELLGGPGGRRALYCRDKKQATLTETGRSDFFLMTRPIYLALGVLAFATGFAGIFLPLVPTVPLMLLAAFCFGRSNPALERRLLEDPRFGPHIVAWRARRAIPRRAKWASTLLVGLGAIVSLLVLEGPWQFVGPAFGAVLLPWVWTRPD
jgi:uncharacterized membrane protein YbaN (DUF454 family)